MHIAVPLKKKDNYISLHIMLFSLKKNKIELVNFKKKKSLFRRSGSRLRTHTYTMPQGNNATRREANQI